MQGTGGVEETGEDGELRVGNEAGEDHRVLGIDESILSTGDDQRVVLNLREPVVRVVVDDCGSLVPQAMDRRRKPDQRQHEVLHLAIRSGQGALRPEALHKIAEPLEIVELVTVLLTKRLDLTS